MSRVLLWVTLLCAVSGCFPDLGPLDARLCERTAECGVGQACVAGYCSIAPGEDVDMGEVSVEEDSGRDPEDVSDVSGCDDDPLIGIL
jgi:hypothetical protein